MAGVSTEQGSGDLNVELNLVPFIDLLSSLVLFLLLSAVWVHISAIPASVDSKGKAAAAAAVPTETERLVIRLTAAGYRLTWPAAAHTAKVPLPSGFSKVKGAFDWGRLSDVAKSVVDNSKVKDSAISADDLI